ncbi:MAG TPA: MFS transporter [Gammaproteobacteria bacterium]|nr:MFS transporter [Gammaproteobacteria bacterium]
MEIFKVTGALLGGLGLFLLAIGMMTEGLKLAAGPSLRKLLSNWSSTPLKGIFSGFMMTAIVQSSSAVMVASLGFVNAGLISMRQALGIVYGANVGTTMTGWLVALIGFNLNIHAFALPMIGVGMVARLVAPRGKLAAAGLALVGFGLFFVGIDVLKTAFEGLVHTFDISKFTAEGVSGMATFFLIGIVMTILTQSSSASIALTITAAASGMVGLHAASAMVIGANVGTTSTAVIASIGATSYAKRVASAQVLFNLGAALVAFLILPILFYLITGLGQVFELTIDTALFLALFHTIFNVLGVLLVYPHNDRLAQFLDKRFLSWEEKESRPRFLDRTIAKTPVLAVNALMLELQSIAPRIIDLYAQAVGHKDTESKNFEDEVQVVKSLSIEVSNFIVNVESSALSQETTQNLAILMRSEQYFLGCAYGIERMAAQWHKRERLKAFALEQAVNQYVERVLKCMTSSYLTLTDNEITYEDKSVDLQQAHDEIKAELILSGTRAQIPVSQMSEAIDCLAEVMGIVKQWYKALTRLTALQRELNRTADVSPASALMDPIANNIAN